MMALLSVKEAAEALHVHENTIRYWVKNGMLRSYRVTPRGKVYINETDLRRMLKKLQRWNPEGEHGLQDTK